MRKIDTGNFKLATRSTPRDVNRQIALNLVREHQPISRADLARRMSIGRGMVTALIGELLEDGLVYEGHTLNVPRGRKPMMLYVRAHDRLVIAIDVRVSRTHVELSDIAGTQIVLESFATPGDPEALATSLAARARRLLEAHGGAGQFEGIGLVIPGMVDRQTGRVILSPTMGWRDVEVRRPLEEATGLPVYIENGPIACALAQMWLGKRPEDGGGNFTYLSVFDGVGAGIVMNGQILRGHGDTAGEFGHIPLVPDGPRCLCGARGCLEAYTSNLATLARYLDLELAAPDTRARLIEAGLTVGDVIARARTGDERALATILETGRWLGLGVAMIVSALNPARIYVGGEITGAWDLIEPLLRSEVTARALSSGAAGTALIPQPVSPNPRLRGAIALVAAPIFAAPQVA
jgi:N-acetylglucosamine repressor